MAALRKSLLELLFSGSYLRRWNDKLRPVELYEIDKQAHKLLVAWMLTVLHSRGLSASKRRKLQQTVVEQGVFDYLFRLIITDIKPPIFYKIKENQKDFKDLSNWVLSQLEPVVKPFDVTFWERLVAYHNRRARHSPADRILEAAHLYASQWEYATIRALNLPGKEGIEDEEKIEEAFLTRLDALTTGPQPVRGLDELRNPAMPLGRLAAFCGQLRFQIRWSGTPRVPETSVLGHMFLVACFAYLFSLSVEACSARCVNNFFAGLIHDLPELLTRDIISPVKKGTGTLARLVRSYEDEELERRLFAPLRDAHPDLVTWLRYYLGQDGEGVESEFDETVLVDGVARRLPSFDALHAEGNHDELDPKDGALLKACDNLAAFMEAYASVRNGISAPLLYEPLTRIRTQFRDQRLGSFSLGTLLADFD